MAGVPNAMVGDTGLGEIVRADLGAPIPGSHLRLSILGDRLSLLLLRDVQEPGPQYLQSLGLILCWDFSS